LHTPKTKQYIESAKRTFRIEASALTQTSDALDELDFANACEILLAAKGRVVVSGVGKSGHIARKIASTLSSTGTPALFLHPAEAAHGDIGLLQNGDALIVLSKSGESDELAALIRGAKEKDVPIVAITSNASSHLAKNATISLYAIVSEEACPHDLAPTTSTTVQLAIGDAIAIALLEARNFTSEDFAKLHPGGALGRRLTMTVRDLMVASDSVPRIHTHTVLAAVMLEMSAKRLGSACVVDDSGKLIGIVTDGDLRRFFQQQEKVEIGKVTAKELMSPTPKTTSADTLAIEALHVMEDTLPKVMQLPVLDSEGVVIGMIHIHEIVRAGIG
jgi:arabinose-5-phosphate isomerase